MTYIPLLLINGSLGSGKTTFVRHLLASEAWSGSMLIENEFASVNIDQQIVSHDHHNNVVEISGTCICCSTGEELEEALEQLARTNWQAPVIIEATGMANSAKLAERLYLNTTFLERFAIIQTVLLIDPLEVQAGALADGLKLEVKLSDTVIINKTDLADDVAVAALVAELGELNAEAKIVTASRSQYDLAAPTSLESAIEARLTEHAEELSELETDTATTYAVVKPDRSVDPEALAARLEAEAGALGLRRVKGFVRDAAGVTWLVEATGNHAAATRLDTAPQPVLVAIGQVAGRDIKTELDL